MHHAFIFGASRYGEAPSFSPSAQFYWAPGGTGLTSITVTNLNEFEMTLTMPKFVGTNTPFAWESTGTPDGNGGIVLTVPASSSATMYVRYSGAANSYASSSSTGTATLPGTYSVEVVLTAEHDSNN